MISQESFNRLKEMRVSLSLDELLGDLHDRYRWPIEYLDGQPTIEVITPSGAKERSLFGSDGYLIPEIARSAYDEGYTLILSRCQWINTSVAEFTRTLMDIGLTAAEPNANIYLGTGEKSISFPIHSHDYDVLVKNVEGVSTWIVSGESINVTPQQVVSIPSHSDHAVINIKQPKLSLTYNLA